MNGQWKGNNIGDYDEYKNRIETSKISKDTVICRRRVEAHICSLIPQRGMSGRIGRLYNDEEGHQQWDILVVSSVNRAYGSGLSVNDNDLRQLSENKIDHDEKEAEECILRAGTIMAIKRVQSREVEERRIREQLKKLGEKGDGYALFVIGLSKEMGVNGFEKDPKQAKEYYERSEQAGFSDGRILAGSILTGKKMNVEDEEWYPYLFRIQMMSSIITELNLSGFKNL